MGALAVSQLLENAQDMGVHLTLETAAVENQVMQISRQVALNLIGNYGPVYVSSSSFLRTWSRMPNGDL